MRICYRNVCGGVEFRALICRWPCRVQPKRLLSYGQIGDQTGAALAAFYDNPALLQVLSVSEDTHSFLARNLGLADSSLSRIVNAIEPSFKPDGAKTNRMHWMPRKNPDHVQAVMQGLQRCGLRHSAGWQGEPLAQLSHSQVAERLNGARLFLAFGHPEGFACPSPKRWRPVVGWWATAVVVAMNCFVSELAHP